MSNKGLTLVELLIVIVVIGIIGGFTGVSVTNIVHNTRVKVDSRNVDTLNSVTANYANWNMITSSDIFAGLSTDEERMQVLISEGALSKTVEAQQNGASFEWDVTEQRWTLVGGEYIALDGVSNQTIDFSETTIQLLEDDGTRSIDIDDWTIVEDGLINDINETRLFIPVGDNEYTITVNATLSNNNNSGGYGIFFDTILENDDETRDTGFILQFDRGMGSGEIIVRPREGGSESNAVERYRSNELDFIPSKYDDPDWWSSTHEIEIVVEILNESTNQATFFIDGNKLGEFQYNTDHLDGSQLYTGFRGWNSNPTTFDSLTIQEHR
jgi:prepilin-type N-terminal cleavage/methylation domain-containing protein